MAANGPIGGGWQLVAVAMGSTSKLLTLKIHP